jgi:hypothetical protein
MAVPLGSDTKQGRSDAPLIIRIQRTSRRRGRLDDWTAGHC